MSATKQPSPLTFTRPILAGECRGAQISPYDFLDRDGVRRNGHTLKLSLEARDSQTDMAVAYEVSCGLPRGVDPATLRPPTRGQQLVAPLMSWAPDTNKAKTRLADLVVDGQQPYAHAVAAAANAQSQAA